MIAEHTEHVLHAMLEKAPQGGAGRSANEQKIGDAYAACMDVDAINKRGLTPLQPELDRIAALKSKDELARTSRALSADWSERFSRLSANNRTSRMRGSRLPWSIREAWGFPNATTISAPAMRRENPGPVCAAHHQHAEACG